LGELSSPLAVAFLPIRIGHRPLKKTSFTEIKTPRPQRRGLDPQILLKRQKLQSADRTVTLMDEVSNVNAQKTVLRKRMRRVRAEMSPAAREKASARMVEGLERLPVFQQAGGVHCFIGLPEEVDTSHIFKLCQQLGKPTYVPIQVPGENRLDVASWRPGEPLAPGPFSVPEPHPGEGVPVDRSGIHLVLAPGLAFDRQGGRLGYGRGFYDGFLAAMAAEGFHPVVIGLGFSLQMVERVPRGPWDVFMDAILTEAGFSEREAPPPQ